MHTATDRLSIRLLGPFSALIHGQQITPTAAKQRQVFALLALNAGRVVPVSSLTEELWGDAPPRSYATILQSYIMQLRNRLRSYGVSEQDRSRIISTQHSGYLLDEAASETDADEFSRIARLARAAGESGDFHRSADLARKALDLWRGPALTNVPVGRHLELELISLDERRLGLLERRIQADLELNRHTDLIGELRSLTFQYPLNENLSAFLMIALYRAGHAARALGEFHRIRFALRAELGIEPSPRLAGIANAVLVRDAALDEHGRSGQARSAGLPSRRAGYGGQRVHCSYCGIKWW